MTNIAVRWSRLVFKLRYARMVAFQSPVMDRCSPLSWHVISSTAITDRTDRVGDAKELSVFSVCFALLLVLLSGCASRVDRAVDGSVGPDEWAIPWQRTATLNGQVFGHEGAPLAEARVSLGVYYYGDDDRVCVVETDRHGRFRVDRVPAGVEIRVNIEHPDHVAYGELLGLLRPDREYSFHAQLDRGIPLRFQMVDRNGRVIPEVEVDNWTLAKQTMVGDWVDVRLVADQHASFGIGTHGETITLWPPNPVADRSPLDRSFDPDVRFSIDPDSGETGPPDHPSWLRVRLSESDAQWSDPRRMIVPWILHSILTVQYPDGTPVVGATVSVREDEGFTDARGRFACAFPDQPNPDEMLRVTKGDYSVEVPVGDGRELHSSVVVPRGGDLEIRLEVDSPVCYRSAFLDAGEGVGEGDGKDLTTGRLLAENLRPGVVEWHLSVQRDSHDYYEGTATIHAARVTRLTQQLEALKMTRHRVHVVGPDGRPVSGAHVRTWWGDSFTDEAGNANLDLHWAPSPTAPEGAPPEPVRLQVAAEGFGVQDFERTHHEAFEIQLAAPAHLRVTARLAGIEVERLTDFGYEAYEPNVTVLHPNYFRGETPGVWHEEVSLPLDLTLSPGHYAIGSDRTTPVEIELKSDESRSLELQVQAP